MNNNIPNMNGVTPAGYNPQQNTPAQPQVPQDSAAAAEINTPNNADPLKFVPNEASGRTLVQNTGSMPPPVNPKNIADDTATFKLMQEFGNELMQGYIQKGVDPQRAQYLANLTMDVLLNPPANMYQPQANLPQ